MARLILNRDGYEVLVERDQQGYSTWGDDKMERVESFEKPKDVNYLKLHCENFVEAMQTNNSNILKTPIDSGSVAAINAQMGNIAFKTGKKIYWDANKECFKKNKKANKLMKKKYHNGWKKP